MKVSICGLGIMGNNHLRACISNGYNIVSTFDPRNNDEYKFFLESLSETEALIIASPTNFHTKNILDSLQVNSKLKILCEKPISFSSNDEFLIYLKPYEKNILIGQVERFNPVINKLKSILSSLKEDIIQIKTLRVNNTPAREPIDIRKDIGIHDLDIACFLLDNFPKKVDILNNDLEKFKSHENLFYKIKNTQVVNEVSWKYPFKDRKISVLTESGIYEAHYYNQTLKFIDWSNNEQKIEIERKEPLIEEIKFLEKMVKENISSNIIISDNIKLLNLLGY